MYKGVKSMKKTIGIVLLVLAGMSFLGNIVNGSFAYAFSTGGIHGSGVRTGMFLGYALLIIGGIALIRSSKK